MRVVERTQGAGEGEAESTAVVRLEDGGTGTSRPLRPLSSPASPFLSTLPLNSSKYSPKSPKSKSS